MIPISRWKWNQSRLQIHLEPNQNAQPTDLWRKFHKPCKRLLSIHMHTFIVILPFQAKLKMLTMVRKNVNYGKGDSGKMVRVTLKILLNCCMKLGNSPRRNYSILLTLYSFRSTQGTVRQQWSSLKRKL